MSEQQKQIYFELATALDEAARNFMVAISQQGALLEDVLAMVEPIVAAKEMAAEKAKPKLELTSELIKQMNHGKN